MQILRELNHPNVVNIYQFYPKDPAYYYVVLEYLLGGELFDRIVKKVRQRARSACLTMPPPRLMPMSVDHRVRSYPAHGGRGSDGRCLDMFALLSIGVARLVRAMLGAAGLHL